MKRLLLIVVVLILVAGVVFAQQQRFRNGVFTGTGVSYNSATESHAAHLLWKSPFAQTELPP
jgi:uncharacterized protein (UPF0333 family)